MRHPNEYWLKYLLASGVSPAKVVKMAEMYLMPLPSKKQLDALSKAISKTKPKPFRLSTPKTRAWIRNNKLHAMFYAQPSAQGARSILSSTKLRTIVEYLILADVAAGEICGYCEELAGERPAEESVVAYRHYFWNRDLLAAKEWEAYAEFLNNGKDLLGCYLRGEEYALWKLGYRVELPQQELVKAVLHEAAMRYFETGSLPNNRNTAVTAKLWSETLFRSLEEINKTGDAVKQAIDELKSISIKLGRRDISGVDDLSTVTPAEEPDGEEENG